MNIYLVKEEYDEYYSTVIKAFLTMESAKNFIKEKEQKEEVKRQKFYRCEGKCYNCIFSREFMEKDIIINKTPKCLNKYPFKTWLYYNKKNELINKTVAYECLNKKYPIKPQKHYYIIKKVEVKK